MQTNESVPKIEVGPDGTVLLRLDPNQADSLARLIETAGRKGGASAWWAALVGPIRSVALGIRGALAGVR